MDGIEPVDGKKAAGSTNVALKLKIRKQAGIGEKIDTLGCLGLSGSFCWATSEESEYPNRVLPMV